MPTQPRNQNPEPPKSSTPPPQFPEETQPRPSTDEYKVNADGKPSSTKATPDSGTKPVNNVTPNSDANADSQLT